MPLENSTSHMADRYNMVGTVQPRPLHIVDSLIDMVAAAIEFRRMDMNHKRFSGHVGNSLGSRKGYPVMSVYYIKRSTCNRLSRLMSITVYLTKQIVIHLTG